MSWQMVCKYPRVTDWNQIENSGWQYVCGHCSFEVAYSGCCTWCKIEFPWWKNPGHYVRVPDTFCHLRTRFRGGSESTISLNIPSWSCPHIYKYMYIYIYVYVVVPTLAAGPRVQGPPYSHKHQCNQERERPLNS